MRNAKALADGLQSRGFTLVSGGALHPLKRLGLDITSFPSVLFLELPGIFPQVRFVLYLWLGFRALRVVVHRWNCFSDPLSVPKSRL